MSLYNMLHGVNPNAPALLHALNLNPTEIQRLRDVSFGKDGDDVVVHIFCRTGGGNREDFPNKVLTEHPAYIRDEDDDYDCTYAHYYFKLPEAVKQEVEAQGLKLEELVDTETLKDKTDQVLEALKTGPVK
jgi:hypothetical protein